MWNARNRHFAQQFFDADTGSPSGGAAITATQINPPAPPKQEKPEFTPEQQEALNALLARERKDAEERTALRLKQEADAKAKAEQEARDHDNAAARGEFDKVRADLESKVALAEGERDALATEAETLRAYFDGQFQAALADLPEAILAFKPAEDADVSTKTAWLTKAQEQAKKLSASQTSGNHPNPKAASGKLDIQTEVARAKSSGRYNM